jgi:tRNA nucleotidyltransferase/poly(A) polymerase
MELVISNELNMLAEQFAKLGRNLYVVGGYVRNSLLNIGDTDIDICGAIGCDGVVRMCHDLGFRAQVVNQKLGTVLISTPNDEQYEYTQFRAESYATGGEHTPEQVVFVEDIKVDAKRRDFTVNSLYYDIINKQIVDLFGGVNDIKKGVLKTCQNPEKTFADDGLRILRLVRFACEYGFKIDSKTFKVAKKVVSNIKDISRERVLKEIKTCVVAGFKHNVKQKNHKQIVTLFNKLKVWKYVFNSSFDNFVCQTKGPVYNAFVNSDGDSRYIAFMCLVLNSYLKAKTTDANLIALVHNLLGGTGLKDSTKSMQEVLDAYRFAQRVLYDKPATYINNRSAIGFELLGFEIKNYMVLINPNKVNAVKSKVMELRKNNVPFYVSELNITNEEMIKELRIKNQYISAIKQRLFEMCVDGAIINDNQVLIEQAKFLNENIKYNKTNN